MYEHELKRLAKYDKKKTFHFSATTTTDSQPDNGCDNCGKPLSFWDVVGASYLSSIFNDATVLFVAAVVLLILKFAAGYHLQQGSAEKTKDFLMSENVLRILYCLFAQIFKEQ